MNKHEKSLGRLPNGYIYRLPTEAEWEFACRGGTQTIHFFNSDKDINKYAWVGTNQKHIVFVYKHIIIVRFCMQKE